MGKLLGEAVVDIAESTMVQKEHSCWTKISVKRLSEPLDLVKVIYQGILIFTKKN